MRRLAAGLLVCALWAPSLLPVVRAAAAACACTHGSCCCAPQKHSRRHGGCHETRDPRTPVLSCAHVADGFDLPQVAAFLLPQTTALLMVRATPGTSSVDAQPASGFDRHESPPPKDLRYA